MNDERTDEIAGEGTPTVGGDLVGPGTGGIPTGAGTGEPPDPADAASDADVAALTENLRGDSESYRRPPTDAAEEAGTGTDR